MRICLLRPRIPFFRGKHHVHAGCGFLPSTSSFFIQSPKESFVNLTVANYSTSSPVPHGVDVPARKFARKDAKTLPHNNVKGDGSGLKDLNEKSPWKLQTTITGAKRTNPEEWMRLAYQFLPVELRCNLPENKIPDNLPTCKDRKILSRLLRNARAQNIDLIAFMGLTKGFWEEAMYLVETLLEDIHASALEAVSSQLLSNILWSEGRAPTSLREMCSNSIEVEYLITENSRAGSENVLGWWREDPSEGALLTREFRLAMREIWQSLGTLVIEASDMPPERMRSVMGWVYQIIAQLHHSGMVPDSIYQYQVSRITSSTARSPVLYMLSTRILTALSDTVFTKESREIPGMAYRLKGGDPFPNVWLEFILWCCVDSDFVEEGVWILERLKERDSFSNWGLVDWTGYEPDSESTTGWVFGKNQEQNLQRFLDQTEERTLSSQVVTAIIDGLVSDIQHGQLDRRDTDAKLSVFPGRLYKLLSMMERHRNTSMESTSFDRLIMRILESGGFSVQQMPPSAWEALHQIESFRPAPKRDPDNLTEMSTPLKLDLVVRAMNPVSSVLHQLIENFSRLGDSRRALLAFDDIQLRLDESRKRNITLFGKRLDSLEQFNASYHGAAAEGYFVPAGEMPDRVLGRFLDTVTEADCLDFGTWLLYSADTDGPTIHPGRYGSPQLGPALLRFAQATSDRRLFSRVVNAAPTNPSVAFLHAVLNARLTLHEFDLAGPILKHLRDTIKGSYGEVGGYRASNLSTLAAALIKLKQSEEETGNANARSKYKEGLSLFEKMLRGDFRNRFNYSIHFEALKDHLVSSVLGILESFSNPLHDIAAHYRAFYKTSQTVRLPAPVFDPLLSAVADTHGSVEAKRLWDLHCYKPADDSSEPSGTLSDVEAMAKETASESTSAEHWRLACTHLTNQSLSSRAYGSIPFANRSHGVLSAPTVMPEIWTLRIIVRSALNEIAVSTKTKALTKNTIAVQDVLDWSVVMFKKFGLRPNDINFEYGNARSSSKAMSSDRVLKIYKGQHHLLLSSSNRCG